MCPALRDLMKDEIAKIIAEERAEERVEAITDTRLRNIRQLMKNMKWSAEQAMKALGISDADQAKYSAMI